MSRKNKRLASNIARDGAAWLERHGDRRMRWSRKLLLGSTGLGGVLAGLALGAGSSWSQIAPNTLPSGGMVTAGSATINQANPNTLNINQTTNRAVINWNSFDVGANASVNFYQPNSGSWTLNRVTNSIAPSTILGHITANGNIAVINSNGVIFGAGSRVDVNGLIATTANITDQNFMSGNMKFDQAGNPTATVINQGDITVKDAGLVAFVAPGVSNSGTITARFGSVSLAAGQRFTIDLYGDKLVSIATNGDVDQRPIGPDGKPLDALVDNSGRIVADGGQVQLTARQAKGIVDTAVNMSGVVQAQSAFVDKNGDIVLDGGSFGDVKVTGTLDASGKLPGTTGGNITVTGKDTVTIGGTAKLDASGSAGGGKIKIGGDFHGQGATPTAKRVTVASGAQINANAIDSGNGGQIVVWADDTTTFHGNISARGGQYSGNGGVVEVSGKGTLIFSGATVDTRAPNGQTGSLLLDPTSVNIVDGANDAVVTGGTITDGTLNTLLGTTDVTVTASGWGDGGPGNGVITVQSGVVLTLGGNKLTLVADNDAATNIAGGTINIASTVSISGGTLELQAGTVHLSSDIAAAISNAGANAPSQVFIDTSSASIQDGINIAGSGATLQLAAATTWNELITINKGLTLQGGTNSVLNGSAGSGSVITVNAAGGAVVIDHVGVVANNSNSAIVLVSASSAFTFSNGSVTGAGLGNTANGIQTTSANTAVTVANSTVNNTGGTGLLIDPVFGPVVVGNTVFNVGANGIEVTGASGNITVAGNTVNATGNHGIYVHGNSGTVGNAVSITGNTVGNDNTLGDIGGSGIFFENNSSAYVGSISISGNKIGADTDGAGGLTAANIGGSGIVFQEITPVIVPIDVSGNTIGASGSTIAGNGISLNAFRASGTIGSNVIAGVNGDGISITSVFGALTVSDNTIANATTTGSGIHVTRAAGMTIEDNLLSGGGSGGTGNGVYIDDASNPLTNVLIDGNTIHDYSNGVRIVTVLNASVLDNDIYRVTEGINLTSQGAGATGGGVTITGNTINAASDIALNVSLKGTSPGDLATIGNNTIGNDNVDGNIGVIAINVSGDYQGAVKVVGNFIGIDTDGTLGASAATINGSGIQLNVTNASVSISSNTIGNAQAGIVAKNTIKAMVIDHNIIDIEPGAGTVTFRGIEASFVTGGLIIDHNTISGSPTDGMLVNNVGATTITSNSIANASGHAIQFQDGSGSLTIANNTLSDTALAAILLRNSITGGVTISGNSIANVASAEAILNGATIGGGALIRNNVIDSVKDGIVNNGVVNGAFSIDHNTVTTVSRYGIAINGDNGGGPLVIAFNTLTGAGTTVNTGDGIFINSGVGTISNVLIANNSVSAFGSNGIFIDPVFGQSVVGNTITGVGGDGIEVVNPIGNVTITGNVVNATGGNAIYLHGAVGTGADTISISGNTIDNNGLSGGIGGGGIVGDTNTSFAGNILIDANLIGVDTDGAGGATPGPIAGSGIWFKDNGGNVTVSGNTVSAPQQRGIWIDTTTGSVDIGTNVLTNSGQTMIEVDAGATAVNIHGNSATGSLDRGIAVFASNAVAISGNTISTSQEPVFVQSGTGGLTIAGNTMYSGGGDGIHVEGNVLGGTTITANALSGFNGSAIHVIGSIGGDLRITGNYVTLAPTGVDAAGIVSGNASIDGNIIAGIGSGGGIVVNNSVAGNLQVNANTIDNVTGSAIRVLSDNGSTNIENNRIATGFLPGFTSGTVTIASATLGGSVIGGTGIDMAPIAIAGNVTIAGNQIGGTTVSGFVGGDGIHVTGAQAILSITGNAIGDANTQIGNEGIEVAGGSTFSAVTIASNTVSYFGASGSQGGIYVAGMPGSVDLRSNNVHDGTGDGIHLASTGTAVVGVSGAGNTVDNVTGNGIEVSFTTGALTINGNRLASVVAGSTIAGHGIFASGNSGDVTIAGNQIANNAGLGGIVSIGSDGILVLGPAARLIVSGNIIGDADTRIASSGIEVSFGSPAADITIAGNTIVNFANGSAGSGVRVSSTSSPATVQIYSNTIHDGFGDGIFLNGVGLSTIGGVGTLANIIDTVGGSGVRVGNFGQVTVVGNLIATSGTIVGSGITIDNGTEVDVRGNRIGNNSTGTVVVVGGNGIAVNSFVDATINGNTIGGGATNDSRIGGTGIALSGGNMATVGNNVVRNTGYSDASADGIRFAPGGTISAVGNSVFNVADNGIELGSLSGQFVSGNTIDANHDTRGGVGGSGIQVNGGFFASITGNSITDVAKAGISIVNVGSLTVGLSGAGNTIGNADSHGVRIGNVGSSTVSGNVIGTTPVGVEIFGGGPALVSLNSVSVTGTSTSAGITLGGTAAPVQVLFNDVRGANAGNGIYTGDGNFTIQNNNVTGFDTGLRIAIGTAVNTSANSVFDNNFSGNTVGVVHDGTGVVQASGNYWGFANDTGAFANYFFTSGTTIGTNSGNIDVTPFLKDGTDGNGAAVGFTGNFRNLFVTDLASQLTGGALVASGRVQEAVNLIPAGAGTNSIELAVGTFLDNVVINRADITNLKLYGQGQGLTALTAAIVASPVISVTALSTVNAGDLTIQDLSIGGTTGANAHGIVTTNISHVLVSGVRATNLTGANAVGFNFSGGSDVVVLNSTVTNSGGAVGNDGIRFSGVSGASVGGSTIDSVGNNGIAVINSTNVVIGNGTSINAVAHDGIKVQSNASGASSATLGGVTIVNATDNGVNIVSGSGNTASVAFTGGTSISNNVAGAFNAVRVQGAQALFTLPAPDGTTDLTLNIQAGDATQNYFLLTNNAMGGTVTLGYDVNFQGLTGALSSLQTFGLTAAVLTPNQIAALFQIEDHMVHAVDNTSLGLIRLIPDALFPTATGGLNGVRNAIQLSSNLVSAQDSVFLQAGDYADPSNLVTNGLVIDRNIRLIGAQAGVSATGGARNPTDAATETILDFGAATSPTNGIRITDPSGGAGVLIDGVVVQVDAGQAYGIRIDTNAARDNISILNSFVRGSSGTLGTGNGIETAGGTSTVSHLTITNDVVEYFAGDGIHLDRADTPVVQNNWIRTISGNGIFLDRSSGVVILSGNTVEAAGLDAIFVDRSFGALSVSGNTIRTTSNDGIVIDRSGAGAAVLNNLIAGGAGEVVHGDGIRITRTQAGGVTVSGNSIATGANSATDLRGIFINGVSAGGVTIHNNTLASGAGSAIGAAVGVTVSPNDTVNGASGDAIFVRNVTGSATIDGNLVATGANSSVAGRGIGAWSVGGNVLIDNNVMASGSLSTIGATGIEVFDTGGSLTVSANTIASGFGALIAQSGFTSGDGIDIGTVQGSAAVVGNQLFAGQGATGVSTGISIFDIGADVLASNNTIASGSLALVGNTALSVQIVAGSAAIAQNNIAGGNGSTIEGTGIFAGDIDGSLNVTGNVLAGGAGARLLGSGILVLNVGGSATISGNAIAGGATVSVNGDGLHSDLVANDLVIDGNTIAQGASARLFATDAIFADRSGSLTVSNNIIAGGASSTVGSGIIVDRTANTVSITGNSLGLGASATIGGFGIHVEDTATGPVVVSANVVHNTGNSGIDVLRTSLGNVSVLGNSVLNAGGDGISVKNTGQGGGGSVFVLSNSIDTVAGDGVLVDPTVGDVTVNGQNILNVAGNGIRVFQTSGKVIVGAGTASGNTVNNTGRNGILVDNTGEIPGPIVGTGGVTVSGNTLANLAGSTIGASGAFDAIGVTDTLRGSVLVSLNTIASGNNSVVTRDGVRVINTSGNGASGGDVSILGNTIGAGLSATIANNGVFVDNTVLGSVFVSANRIGVGGGDVIGNDGVHVEDTGVGAVSIGGNTIANNTVTIGGDAIQTLRSGGNVTVAANTIASNTDNVGGYGIVVDTTHGAAGAFVTGNTIGSGGGAVIGLDAIRVIHTDVNVVVSTNRIGASATIGGDGVHVQDTTGSVTVAGNTVGNGGTAVGDDGIEVGGTTGTVSVVANTVINVTDVGIHVLTASGAVTVAGNTVTGTGDHGAFVEDSGATVLVSANTIDFVGNDGVRVATTAGAVQVLGNRIATANGSTVGGNGISVIDTASGGVTVGANTIGGTAAVMSGNGVFANNNFGGVTVSGNSINTGASGELDGDGVHVDHTGSGSVYVLSNSIGNLNVERDGDGIDVANTTLGGVTVTGNTVVDFGGFGIHVAQTYGQVVVGGGTASGNTLNALDGDAIHINDTGINGGPGGVLAAGNQISTFSTVFSSGIVILDTLAGNVTVSNNRIGTGNGRVVGDAIRVLDTSLGGVTVDNNVLGNNATTNAIGQDGIQIGNTGLGVLVSGNSLTNIGFGSGSGRGIAINRTGLSGNGDTSILGNTVVGAASDGIVAQSIGGNVLASTGSVANVGDTGMRIDVANNVTVSGFTITGSGNHGLHLRNIANGMVTGVTITNSTNDGLRLSRTDDTGPSMAVSVSSTTIEGAGAAGLRLFDNDGTVGGGTIALKVGSGISIANAATGLIVDGPDTRNIGNTLNDLKFTNIGGGTGNYIVLQNAGWYENDGTPNGAFNPTQIDATNVSFDGVIAGSLDPANNPADVTALANLELRIVHFLDDATLGLIRIQANSITLPTANGLNGIQLADYASANGDTIYLVAGTYGDPSDLVPNGVIIDKQITLLGWQHGVSAKNGGRDGVTGESILDFAGATIAPTAGLVIKESNVTIDGVVVLLDGSATGGGIVVDTSVARANIAIVNNFVHGTSLAFAGGAGIATNGSDTVTGLNISDNVVEFVNGHAITIDQARNLTIQNNQIGNAAFGASSVLGSGIIVTNSSFATAVSGNMLNWVAGDGINLSNVIGGVAVDSNSLIDIGGFGIQVLTGGNVTINGNTLDRIDEFGIRAQNVANVTVDGNTLSTIGTDGIQATNVANVTIADNALDNVTASGIVVQTAAGVHVIDNALSTIGTFGISVQFAAGVTASGNTLSSIGNSGIVAMNVGNTTVDSNTLTNIVGNGIQVQFAGQVQANGNTLSTIGNNGISVFTVGDTRIDNNSLDGVSTNGIIVDIAGAVAVNGNTVSGTGAGGILVLMAGNTTVDNNVLDHIDTNGIVVQQAAGVHIGGNTLTTVGALGIAALTVGNTTIGNNALDHIGGDGIDVTSGADVTINGNTLSSISGNGISASTVGNTTIDNNALDHVTGNGISMSFAGTVDASGNTLSSIGGAGISALTVGNTTIGNNVLDHITGNGISVSFAGTVDASGNTLSSIGGAGISALTVGNTTIDNNALDHVTGNGIYIDIAGTVDASGNTLSSIGGAGISALTVGNTTIDNNALDHVTGGGILVNVAADVTISGNTLSTIGGASGHGIAVFDVANATLNNDTIKVVGGDGVHLERTDDTRPSMAVSISNVTIDGAGAAGLRLFDNDGTVGGGTIALKVGSGISIANAATGLIVDGPDTRNIGNTLNDLKFTNIGGGTGNYIVLQNAGWYENDGVPNGPFNPTQIDATNVSFDGVIAGSLDPANNPADVTTLANLELRIVHFLDDKTLGLIRIQANSITLPTANGLNGIQLADYASANGDTIYLVAGAYGDPSDLVPGGVIIDKQITLLGWQHGVSAKSGGRDGVTGESILDFANATIAPTAGLVIKESNVTIDGVVVLLDGSATGGGIVVDTSVARANIAIVNNFVHGTTVAFAGGSGILTDAGGSTVTNLNVSENVVEYVNGDGIAIANGANVTIQNNRIGNSGATITTVGGDGIRATNSTFGAAVSGNSVYWVQNDGIELSGAGSLVVTNNHLEHALAGNGITVSGFASASITSNFSSDSNVNGIAAVSVGQVTIADNTVVGPGATGDGILVAQSGDVFVLRNFVFAFQGHDIDVTSAGNVVVNSNTAQNAGLDGIHIAGVSGTVQANSNQVSTAGANGISIQDVGLSVEASLNFIVDAQGNGIVVQNTGTAVGAGNGNVTVISNDMSSVGSKGILIDAVDGNVVVLSNQVGDTASAGIGDTGIEIANVQFGVSVSDNLVRNAGMVVTGHGISVHDTGLAAGVGDGSVVANANSVAGATGDGIRIVNIDGGVTMGGTIATQVDGVGGNGVLLDHIGNFTVTGLTATNAGSNGLYVRDAADGTISGVHTGTITGDALRLERTLPGGPAMSVTVSGSTFDGAGGAGIRLFDNDGTVGGNTLAVAFGSGVVISNSATGLIVDGPDTRNIGKTLNDMAFSNIGGGTGNYIVLQNAGWYEDDSTPNGAFNPTQIDATNVSFDGVIAGSLDPANNPADVTTLANLELRIVHFLDDKTLGLIRIQANSITLPTANGLNGIQLADYASANGDTIYLVAGTYGDPSDLVPNGVIIDKQITLLGWQHGVSAKNGGRDGVTGESILDFANATIAPTAGLVIKESNVTIDGVVVLLDGSATGGGIVVDTSVARANIAIVNNFVHGTTVAFGGGSGILTSGADTVTNLNISDNVVEYVNGDGIAIANGANVTIQNNLVGNTFLNTTSVNGDGIRATNTSFGAAVSGNTVLFVANDGIELNGPGDITVSGNSVSHTAAGSGITITGYDNALVDGNTLFNLNQHGIYVDIAGTIAVTDNTVNTTDVGHGIAVTNGTVVNISGNQAFAAASDGINATSVGSVTVADNSISGGIDGIRVQFAGDVSILRNTLGGSAQDGIAAISVAGVTIADNVLTFTGGNGIFVDTATVVAVLDNTSTYQTLDGVHVQSFGDATISGNTLTYIGGDGVDVSNGNGTTIVGNVISYPSGYGVRVNTVDDLRVNGNAIGQISLGGITIYNAADTTVSGNQVVYSNNGDGIAVISVAGLTVANNDVGYSSANGITIFNADDISVLSNTVNYSNANGIAAVSVGNATISNNSEAYTSLNGITIANALAVSIQGNTVNATGSHGIATFSIGGTTISGNTLNAIGANGIFADNTSGELRILDNTLTTIGGVGIDALATSGNMSILGNSLSSVGSTGILVLNGLDVSIGGNVLNTIGANGIDVSFVGATTVGQNTLTGVTGDGIRAASINGALRVLDNSLDGIGVNGIEVSVIFGDASVSDNRLHDVTAVGITTSNTGDVEANGNSLDLIGGNGIVITTATSNAVVQGNTLSRVGGNGIGVGQLTDATITGNVLSSITGTGIAVTQIVNGSVSGNTLSDIGQDGINLSQANDLVIAANHMARVQGDGIDVALVQDITISGNMLSDTGHGAGGAGVRLDNYTTATIVGNSIVNLTATTGMTISNGLSVPFPQANTTIAGNIVSGNQIGIATSGNILGTISGNTITNNSQWGIVVGAGLTQTHVAEGFTFLNLLVTGNLISGNGIPMDHTLLTGGVRNDNIGLVLDARGNNWGDATGPFAGPTHFNKPNPGGMGNAVGDWVLYDIPVITKLPPMVPPFGSLLDSFDRGGGHPHTPGDVLAIGPSFTYNGALFEPYFYDLFHTPFALAEVQGGGNFAVDYGVCYLGDMWKIDACRLPVGSK